MSNDKRIDNALSFDMPSLGKRWFVMYDLRYAVLVIYAFLLAIWALEKKFQTRKPWNITRLLIVHNLISTTYSLAIFVGTIAALLRAYRDSVADFQALTCDEGSHLYHYVAFWIHIFYLSKFYELIDTFILVVRKKHISFLHLFHHSGYVIICCALSASGTTFQYNAVLLNSFIHFAMYGYYFLSSLPSIKPHVRWIARHITTLQIAQFVFGNMWQGSRVYQILVNGRSCPGSSWWVWVSTGVTLGFLGLFSKMYVDRYLEKSQAVSLKQKQKQDLAESSSSTSRPSKLD